MGEAFLGERVQRQGNAGRHADALRTLPKLFHERIRVGIRLGGQQLGREPQNALGFMRDREVSDVLLKVREDLNFGDGFVVGDVHNVKLIALHGRGTERPRMRTADAEGGAIWSGTREGRRKCRGECSNEGGQLGCRHRNGTSGRPPRSSPNGFPRGIPRSPPWLDSVA